ncbi:hypothetical protein ACFWUZ_23930 [Streptomyces sp. NPDC058646]|uniref:hypothetical protein n=1 Tax=Streptomyces sp. NPDC058646 TaxID=3346574 RepID=UPI0036508704
MQLSRLLPLSLAALVLATGCVTVGPAAPPDARHVAPPPAGDRLPPQGQPLGTLPAVAAQPPEPSAEPPQRVRQDVVRPAPARPHRPRGDATGDRARPAQPAAKPRRARTAAPAEPRRRPPAAAKSRPAPQRTYDMAALCAAAEGTVSPAIVALCR